MNSTKRVLIVDDDPIVRQMLATLIEKEQIMTYLAESAEEALSLLSRCEKDHIQVVLIDLSLPGMDGMTLCRKLRRLEPLMVRIALTGFSDLFTLVECREAGFDDYLNKPIAFAVLRAALVSAFKRARYWEALARRDVAGRDEKRPNGSGINV